jgi:hypothetical protein
MTKSLLVFAVIAGVLARNAFVAKTYAMDTAPPERSAQVLQAHRFETARHPLPAGHSKFSEPAARIIPAWITDPAAPAWLLEQH